MDRDIYAAVRSSSTIGLLAFAVILSGCIALHPVEHRATLAFTGDVMLGRGVAQANSSEGWTKALSSIALYTSTADITFANLESPLTEAPMITEGLDLRAAPEAAIALQSAGIGVVSLANNHALDAGPQGIQDTINSVQIMGVKALVEGYEPWVVEKNGLALAWWAFDDTLTPVDIGKARQALAGLRSQVDIEIVSIHWGNEWDAVPNDRQNELASSLAKAGADIIIGHHPHTLQPVRWIAGTESNRPALVAFSMGNALFDQYGPPGARYGALLRVDVGPEGVEDVCAIPFRIDPRYWRIVPAGPIAVEGVKRSLKLDCCTPIEVSE